MRLRKIFVYCLLIVMSLSIITQQYSINNLYTELDNNKMWIRDVHNQVNNSFILMELLGEEMEVMNDAIKDTENVIGEMAISLLGLKVTKENMEYGFKEINTRLDNAKKNIEFRLEETNTHLENIQKLQDELVRLGKTLFKNIDFKPNFTKVKRATVRVQSGRAKGTGTIIKIDEKYLYVLTAKHITDFKGYLFVTVFDIDKQKEVIVENIDRRLLLADNKVDMSIIKVPKPKGTFIYLNIANRIPKEGTKIYAIGHPLNIKYTYSVGIVANYTKKVFGFDKYTYMLISTPAFSGNSGGGVINGDNEIVGILVGILGVRDPNSFFGTGKIFLNNFTFAVSLEHIHRFMEELKI